MEKFYYHISDPRNTKSILDRGLEANKDGDIFLFENKSILYPVAEIKNGVPTQRIKPVPIADLIAKTQIFLDKYAMFEIESEGIEGPLINDNVAELGHGLQWIAKQSRISPEYIKPFGLFKTEI